MFSNVSFTFPVKVFPQSVIVPRHKSHDNLSAIIVEQLSDYDWFGDAKNRDSWNNTIRDDLLKKIKGYLARIKIHDAFFLWYLYGEGKYFSSRRWPFPFFFPVSSFLLSLIRGESSAACFGLFISYVRRYSPEVPLWSVGEVWSDFLWAYHKVDCWWRKASDWARISRWTTSRRQIPLGWIACRSDRETLPVGRLCHNNATPGISSLHQQRSRGRTGRRSRNLCRALSPAPDNPCLADLQIAISIVSSSALKKIDVSDWSSNLIFFIIT